MGADMKTAEKKWFTSIASGIAVVSEKPFEDSCLDARDRDADIFVVHGSYDQQAGHWNLPEGAEEKVRLIGAAPEMLEALKAYDEADRFGGGDRWLRAGQLARAAISKAETTL